MSIHERDQTVTLETPPTAATFYIIEAQSTDWQFLLMSLWTRKGEMPASEAFVGANNGFPVFYFAKSRFTAAEIAKLLGVTVEQLAVAENIILRAIGDQSKWERPTVPYAGWA